MDQEFTLRGVAVLTEPLPFHGPGPSAEEPAGVNVVVTGVESHLRTHPAERGAACPGAEGSLLC